MKNRNHMLVILCMMLFSLLLLSACKATGNPADTSPVDLPVTGDANDTSSESIGETGSATSSPESESDTLPIETEPVPEPVLSGPYASAISHANKLANGVQAYYADAKRDNYRIENQNMTLEYSLSAESKPMVTALTNRRGDAYLQNTMDAFIQMEDGQVFYASNTSASARPNILRYGYYYYELHFLDQDFIGEYHISAEKQFNPRIFSSYSSDVSNLTRRDDGITFTISGGDPYIYAGDSSKFSAKDYNAVQISLKSTRATSATLYVMAGSAAGHTNDQSVTFSLIPDGKFHAYTVFLENISDYTGVVKRFRLDINDASIGDEISVNDLKAVQASTDVPPIVFDRTLHTYSDKLNQVLHFVAKESVTGIASFGMTTSIPAEAVEKLIVKDAEGTHTTLDGVDWNTAEYIGFDIRNVGIFGYILPVHENSGTLKVTLSDGVYTVTQSAAPENGTLKAMGQYTENDFFMGQRLYTDETHSFDGFLQEAEYERHPLTVLDGDAYVGYNALRGAYAYMIGGTGFNEPFFNVWNRHYEADVTIRGTDTDRRIYIYSNWDGGSAEGAALLDENGLLIPIPVMIFKNFGGENEEPIFYHGDQSYSMTLFPMTIDAGKDKSFTILNTMQNWGAFPLKQLSSIQYFAPYYHLSTGVTETSCIAPWYVHGKSLWTLPDFRPMSGIWWFDYEDERKDDQPQHTHAGYHYFLQYTDAEGNYSATENVHNEIISSGLNYSEVLMDYVSDDGKIRVSYNHIEMPQTDEHRAYYEITYEVLEDVAIANFTEDFSFFSTRGYAGDYQRMGYLNENNEIVHTRTPKRGFLLLGDECPYVSFYDLVGAWENKCGNTGFVIYNSDLTIGGKKHEGNFGLYTRDGLHHLTLDLDEVTLKKGDKMSINMVIAPWGSEESEDDSNMIRIRENTCLKPLTVTVQSGEKMDSVFVPRVRATDGKSAEFTLSGGSNHSVVRVYGFDKLTAPKIFEKINGEWVEYTTSSLVNPDKKNGKHPYDGYFAYYDGDGTYSYTFLVDMTDVGDRTFRIEAAEDFAGWPDMPDEADKPLNVYSSAADIKEQIAGAQIGGAELSEDGSYVRIFGDGTSPEAYFTAYTSSDVEATGQYLVFKYRYASGTNPSDIQIYTSTVNSGALPDECFSIRGLVADGEWHIAVIDMSRQGLPTFEATDTGKYMVQYLRMDIFNGITAMDFHIDLSYIGISDSLTDICRLNEDMENATMHTKGPVTDILNLKTGEITPAN